MAEEVKIEDGWGERSEENLRQIAKDIYHNNIFCDRHISNLSDIGLVFSNPVSN